MTISQRIDPRFNGMNGDILINTRPEGIPIGTLPGELYGYPKFHLQVTAEVRVERLKRQEVYETIEHDRVREPLDFAMTTDVWRPDRQDIVAGGATVEPLGQVTKFAHGWTPEKVTTLASLFDWHLNSMTSACAHQEVVWEDEPYRRPSLDLTPNCPITGYKYGHSWLVKPLTEDFVVNLLNLLQYAIDDRMVYVHPSLTTQTQGA